MTGHHHHHRHHQWSLSVRARTTNCVTRKSTFTSSNTPINWQLGCCWCFLVVWCLWSFAKALLTRLTGCDMSLLMSVLRCWCFIQIVKSDVVSVLLTPVGKLSQRILRLPDIPGAVSQESVCLRSSSEWAKKVLSNGSWFTRTMSTDVDFSPHQLSPSAGGRRRFRTDFSC